MAGIVMESQHSNGLESTNAKFQEGLEYEKILKLRDAIVAGTHPRLMLASKAASIIPAPKTSSPPRASTQQVNGVSAVEKKQLSMPHTMPPSTVKSLTYNEPTSSAISSTSTNVNHNSNVEHKAPPKITSSGLDPIFLEKGESLIKAEFKLERQRVERELEEQVRLRRATARERASEEEAMPDFDVTEVLLHAQELVKPIAPVDSHGANGVPSSNDSLDDSTFYSSRVNDSTTDEADDRPRRRMTKPCKYFFEGGSCKKGDACTFSHDLAFKQKLQADVPLTMEVDSDHVSKEPNRNPTRRRLQNDHETRRSPFDMPRDMESDFQQSDLGPSQMHANLGDRPYHHSRDSGEIYEEPQVAPPVLPRPKSNNRYRNNQPRDSLMERNYNYQEPDSPRDPGSGSKRIGRSSPNSKDVRIVRNHITSPVAPQPARVSPLAVAKVPRLDQIRQGEQENYNPRSPRQTASAQQSAQHSPLLASQPINSRKRRRERDPAESGRNVAPRKDVESPMPYIKDEPMSPPPFTEFSVPQHSQYEPVGRQSLVFDSTPPHVNERVVYERRYPEPAHVRVSDLQRASTPVVRRVISKGGHHYEFQEEPEVRQVYSARQPLRIHTPQQDLGQFSASQPRPVRTVSRAMIVRPEADPQPHYRASVQPQTIPYNRVGGPARDGSLSPEVRVVSRFSPQGRDVVPMAPPSRRIIMDQYGQKYYETAPVIAERRASVAPPPQRYVSEQVSPYTYSERPAPRRASVHPRSGQPFDSPSYVRPVHSPGPTSPSFVEYCRAPEPVSTGLRQRVYEPREELYRDDRNEVVRVIEYPPEKRIVEYPPERRIAHAPRYEEITIPREAPVQRMQSVRPSGSHYEIAREQIPRGQTVQPERVIELGSRHDPRATVSGSARQASDGYVPTVSRQFGLKGEDGYEQVRTPTYIPVQGQRPRYQYVAEGSGHAGYSPDGPYEREVVVEEPRSGGRRGLQRL